MPSRFDRDTALDVTGDGTYRGYVHQGWWIERGPNGGYVAAIVLRGLTMAVADETRTPRSFTVHYLAPPGEGEVTLETSVERAGRMLTFVTGRLVQGERLLALAQAAFAVAVPASAAHPEFCDVQPPDVPAPEALAPTVFAPIPGVGNVPPRHIPMRERYEMRWAVGQPPALLTGEPSPKAGLPQAVVGGWIRLTPSEGARPADHLLLAALTDAWLPPIFSRTEDRFGVPTIDLTIHFRAPLTDSKRDDGWYLVLFRSQMAADGFVEEDGEVWSRDGRLLAHSRQLAVMLPVEPA